MLERTLYDGGSQICQLYDMIPEHQHFDRHCPHVFSHVPCTSQELSDRFIGKMRELFGGQSTIDSWTESAKWRGTETLSKVFGPENICCSRSVAIDGLGFNYEPTRLTDAWSEYCAKYHVAFPPDEL
eukprot:gene181-157_t